MRHAYAIRHNYKTGESVRVEFGEIDGNAFDRGHTFNKGFDLLTALLIVNKWNYIAQLGYQRPDYGYFLPTADGAADLLNKTI